MDNSSPADIITARAQAYKEERYADVFEMYSARSDFRVFFKHKENYIEHAVNHQSKLSKLVSLSVLEEKFRGKVGEVRFIEHFIECDCGEEKHINYFTVTTVVLEDGNWRILKEKREIAA